MTSTMTSSITTVDLIGSFRLNVFFCLHILIYYCIVIFTSMILTETYIILYVCILTCVCLYFCIMMIMMITTMLILVVALLLFPSFRSVTYADSLDAFRLNDVIVCTFHLVYSFVITRHAV
eukprot:Rmarinus@m.16276